MQADADDLHDKEQWREMSCYNGEYMRIYLQMTLEEWVSQKQYLVSDWMLHCEIQLTVWSKKMSVAKLRTMR